MRKKKKQIFNATLATVVAASGIVAVAPATTEASTNFKDVKQTDYFYDAILSLQERGIIKGFEDGTFLPNKAVTRGQVAKILAGVLGLDTTNVQDSGFKDIPKTHQYYGAIAALANAGIISGFEDGTFRQGEPVLRNHMAKMIAKGFNLEATGTTPFTDVRADYAQYITALYTNGVTTGKTATTFDGASNVTRGQLATFVVRAETPKTAEDEKEVSFVVDSLTGTAVNTASGTFKAGQDVVAIFKKTNAAALKNAQVTAVIKGNEIVAIKQLTLQAVSTKGAPVVFDGGNATIAGTFTVKSAFIELKNVVVKGGVVVDDVAVEPVASLNALAVETEKTAVTFNNVEATTIEVKRNDVVIHSANQLAKLIVAAAVQVFELNASVKELTVIATPKITLTANAKIDKIVIPDGKTIQSIIANYNSVKANLASIVNTKGETVKVSTGGGGGGGSSSKNTETKPTPTPEKTPETKPEIKPTPEPTPETKPTPDKDKEDFPETGEGPGPQPIDPEPTNPEPTDPTEPTEPVDPLETGEITEAGTYGPETGTQVIDGDLTIHAAGVTLRNVTVTGKLILAAGIGDGDVYLNGVNVAGETIVNGGGDHSVHFVDSILATVIVNKNNGAVRIVAEGNTKVYEVQLESPTIVVEQNLQEGYSGFDDIIVTEALQVGATSSDSVQVQLQGVFETVNSRVANVRINLSAATNVQTLILNALSHISGTGAIQLAQINAAGSTLSNRPQNLVLDITNGSGYVMIGEGDNAETITESYSDVNAEAIVTGIRAAQGVIHVEMDKFIAGLTVNDFDIEAYVRNGDDVTSADSGQVTTSADSGHVTTGDTVFLSNLQYDAAKKRFTFRPLDVQQYKDQVIEIRLTPKHEKLSRETVIAAYTVSTGFGGRITDIYGIGIPNLTIRFREGAGVTSGDVVAVAITDDYGYYTVNVPEGVYTGEFTSKGYVTTYMVATALSDQYLLDQNETAIRAAASQEVKIMLTWDEHPRDLDSHLQGPSSYGDRFHIAYYEKQYTENGLVYADLDWDDVDSYGPETTTIRKLVDGEYRFFVHHYSGANTLRTSGAKVSVFLGNAITPTQTFTVPTGAGNEIYWDVFDLVVTNNGEKVTIRPVNKLSSNRNDVSQIIQNGHYSSIEVAENATQEERTQAVQERVAELYLPEGTNATVSYDEVNNRYVVTYVNGESTQSVGIYPHFYVVTLKELIYQTLNNTFLISEFDTLDNQLAQLQAELDANALLAAADASVSYDETINEFVVSYVKDRATQFVNVYPYFIIVTVEDLIERAFNETIVLSADATLQTRLDVLQSQLNQVSLPEGTNADVSYDEATKEFIVTYSKNGVEFTLTVYPFFYIEDVTEIIGNAFNYEYFEFPLGTTTQQVIERLQTIADDLVLPENIQPTVFLDGNNGRYKVGFDLNGYYETIDIYPEIDLLSLTDIIGSGDYSEIAVSLNDTQEQKVALVQQIVDSLNLPEEANATVVVDDYNSYGVKFKQDDNVYTTHIYPTFILKDSVSLVGNNIQITLSSYGGFEEIEEILLIGGTTADTARIEFEESTDVTHVTYHNPYGTVITFDEERAAGFNLSATTKVLLSIRGYSYPIEVEIVQ
ncbi:MAG: S-layer homology domain-containing protein [Solibacillus sp.]